MDDVLLREDVGLSAVLILVVVVDLALVLEDTGVVHHHTDLLAGEHPQRDRLEIPAKALRRELSLDPDVAVPVVLAIQFAGSKKGRRRHDRVRSDRQQPCHIVRVCPDLSLVRFLVVLEWQLADRFRHHLQAGEVGHFTELVLGGVDAQPLGKLMVCRGDRLSAVPEASPGILEP